MKKLIAITSFLVIASSMQAMVVLPKDWCKPKNPPTNNPPTNKVPDGAMTLALLGGSLAGFALFRRGLSRREDKAE